MAEHTKIAWTDCTFNAWIGCTKVADGCTNCYAENLMDTRYGRVQWGPKGTRSKTKTWGDLRRWDKQAQKAGEHKKVFCFSLADVFEDWNGPILDHKGRLLWKDRQGRFSEAEASGFQPYEIATMGHLREALFEEIDECPNLYFLLLTKRPENILSMWPEDGADRENVWLGTSLASQKDGEYLDRLFECRHLSPVLFASLEPQIGPVDLSPWLEKLDWVIVGGESKQGSHNARPFDIEWARTSVEQCFHAGVPCFVKQLGSNVLSGGYPFTLQDSHGGDMAEWPEDLRVRECPETFIYA